MKRNTSLIASIALLTLSLPLTTNAATQVYDLKNDWSDTQNPNGAWSYRWDGGDLLTADPFPWAVDLSGDLHGLTRTTEDAIVPGHLELGDIYLVIGYTAGVTARWTAPSSGKISISGSAWDANYEGVLYLWWLTLNGLHDGSALSSSTEGSGGTRDLPQDFSSGSGGATALQNISVQSGDQVELTVFLYSWPPGKAIGVNFTVAFTPDSVDPVAAIEALALAVVEMNLQNGIENSLDSKLDAALNALSDASANNDAAACNSLQAFISAVEAQRANQISNTQADQLIASAQAIMSQLNCGG
jgi:hypothetical protein